MNRLLIIILFFFVGCGQPLLIDEQKVSAQFDFLNKAQTSRHEIIKLFGRPHYIHDNGRVLIYEMCPNNNGVLQVVNREGTKSCFVTGKEMRLYYKHEKGDYVALYNLIILLDEEENVEKNNIVRKR